MRNTIMDRFAEKQSRIDQLRVDTSARYPSLWSKMIAEWNTPAAEDRVWLTYSANYLFRTDNLRWAIDPLTLAWRVKDAPKVDAAHDLRHLDFVLLTHRHKDHLDLDLLSALRHLPIIWFVPEFLIANVIQSGVPRNRIVVASPLHPFQFGGIQILPFEGLHWEVTADGEYRGVPAMGYLVESTEKRWLFPGDTRSYDVTRLPVLGPVDLVFAHLWLGRRAALTDEYLLLDSFCGFFLDLCPRRMILTHLNELGRDVADLWDDSHVSVVRSKIRSMSPDTEVVSARMGDSVPL